MQQVSDVSKLTGGSKLLVTGTKDHCNGPQLSSAMMMMTNLLELQRTCLSMWLIGTVRAEPETVISRAWVQSPDLAE